MGHWHGLAKLCLHTDATLAILDSVTASLGQALQEFKMKTCSMFATRELKKEENSRKRKQATQKKASQVKKTSPTQEPGAGNGDRAVVVK
jgi:Sec-independent protein translocase protein TatA